MLRMKAPLRPMSCAARRGAARALSKAAQDYAVTPYRLIAHASESQRAAWAERDLILHSEMRKHVPAALKHNGEEAFDHHLVSVQSVLRSWGAPEYMTNAALFHSIYGTEGFQGFALPLHHRPEIADLIGPRAERLAWIFCMVDRHSVDRTILAPWALDPSVYVHKPPSFFARPELGGFEIPLRTYDEWLDFLALSLADWLEQVEGTANKEVPLPVGEGLLWELGQAWGCTGAHGQNHRPRECEESVKSWRDSLTRLRRTLTCPPTIGCRAQIGAMRTPRWPSSWASVVRLGGARMRPACTPRSSLVNLRARAPSCSRSRRR